VLVWLIAALGVCIGLAAGLVGAGASSFTVLLLAHVAGLDLESAITASLAVVAMTSIVGLVPYAREGAILWKAGIGFSIASTAGSFLGGHVSASIPPVVLNALFVLAMGGAGVAMLWKRPAPSSSHRAVKGLAQRAPTIAAAGLLLGGLTGTVGLGGGFAVVPLLVLLAGVPMRSAVGTSLFVVAMNTLAGLAGHLPHLAVDWRLAGGVGAAASVGSLAGARLGKRIDVNVLRRVFAILMLVGATAQLASSVFR
jgi:uncharacterized protein